MQLDIEQLREQHQSLYNYVYKYGEKINKTFEEVVEILVAVSDNDHLREAILERTKKPKGYKTTIVQDKETGKLRLSTPLDFLGEI